MTPIPPYARAVWNLLRLDSLHRKRRWDEPESDVVTDELNRAWAELDVVEKASVLAIERYLEGR